MTPASHQTVSDMLVRKLETIAPLSREERDAIQLLPARTYSCGPRHDLLKDGDAPSQCCLLVEGWAFRYKLLSEGRRQILSFHVPGDLPDLQSLHLPVMDHSLATLTKATVAFIPHKSLFDLTERFPNLARALWRDTLIDAAVLREWTTSLGQRSAPARMAHLFCELYRKLEAVGLAAEYHCTLPIRQAELADVLGLSIVHINRVLQALRAQELLTLKGQELVILAWDKLARMAEFSPEYMRLYARFSA